MVAKDFITSKNIGLGLIELEGERNEKGMKE